MFFLISHCDTTTTTRGPSSEGWFVPTRTMQWETLLVACIFLSAVRMSSTFPPGIHTSLLFLHGVICYMSKRFTHKSPTTSRLMVAFSCGSCLISPGCSVSFQSLITSISHKEPLTSTMFPFKWESLEVLLSNIDNLYLKIPPCQLLVILEYHQL